MLFLCKYKSDPEVRMCMPCHLKLMTFFVLEILPKSVFVCHSLDIIVLHYVKELTVLNDDVSNKCFFSRMCRNVELYC